MMNIYKDLNINLALDVYFFSMFVICKHIKRIEAKVLQAIVVQPIGPMLEKKNANVVMMNPSTLGCIQHYCG